MINKFIQTAGNSKAFNIEVMKAGILSNFNTSQKFKNRPRYTVVYFCGYFFIRYNIVIFWCYQFFCSFGNLGVFVCVFGNLVFFFFCLIAICIVSISFVAYGESPFRVLLYYYLLLLYFIIIIIIIVTDVTMLLKLPTFLLYRKFAFMLHIG